MNACARAESFSAHAFKMPVPSWALSWLPLAKASLLSLGINHEGKEGWVESNQLEKGNQDDDDPKSMT